ncbi:hypothetical protein C2845_PM05G30120 [Panicum miliaceum]|uniref:F-box domain-containing protein n=1 Tax=Panicum miliaceum TaxID=4540 RepID=A0A3L6T1J3_PANMI|nr:hypothetical protein C2845_PM05G30120 [Panicum miliaceum]
MEASQDDGSELLPGDMLANVLGRLPPCSLAASRCVRKHWCSVIDTRRLLRADLLPLRLDGFFCNRSTHVLLPHQSFFARPSAARRIGSGGRLDFSDKFRHLEVSDHCNGLLRIGEMVVNPATRQWVTLPPLPEPAARIGATEVSPLDGEEYLAYDPMCRRTATRTESSEWSPSPLITHVFSSRKWRWEERTFIRQGEAAGTVADDCSPHGQSAYERQAVYFRGALYVHCQNDSVMRIALSSDKYQMIKSPAAGTKFGPDSASYLGKSEKGVYSALFDSDVNVWPRFRIWLLHESCGQMEWVLKSSISLQALVENFASRIDGGGGYGRPWIVDYKVEEAPPTQDEEPDDDEWDLDNGTILEAVTDDKKARPAPIKHHEPHVCVAASCFAAAAQATVPPSVHVSFNLATDTYDDMYQRVQAVLKRPSRVPYHPSDVKGRHVLGPRRPEFYGAPNRWIKVDVVGEAPADKTTLAIADDDLYLLGFSNASGDWHILRGQSGLPGATALPFGENYGDLVQGGHMNLYTVPLGKQSAAYAAKKLARYGGGCTRIPTHQVKDAMVRFVVMVTEATRFRAIRGVFSGSNWQRETFITPVQARYVVHWGQLSRLLVEWERSKCRKWGGDGFSQLAQSVADDIAVRNSADALEIVDFLIRPE